MAVNPKQVIPKVPELISWAALKGSQEHFLQAKHIFEVLYEGTRGPGKTDTLIMDFYSDVSKGYGQNWRGILFRQTYKQLTDVINKTKKWFSVVCPKARYNASDHFWTFPDGEILYLRQFKRDDDYYNYHGHEYPWVAWEELTNWATPNGYKMMMSTCRSSDPEVAKIIRYRATTNPYGVGHNWIKNRFNLPGARMVLNETPLDAEGRPESPRLAIHGYLAENTILMEADPKYIDRLRSAARNEAELSAWVDGSWDIVAGGMFDDIWTPAHHVVIPFELPTSWRIDRSFDWGSSAPFSVGWWAESDGSDVQLEDGSWEATVRGDLYRIAEWYGCHLARPNEGLRMLATEVAEGIIQREVNMGIYERVKAGPADGSIYTEENGNCIADDMAKKVRLPDGRIYKGASFVRADKRPGSRKTGWELLRKKLKHALPNENGNPRENPGIFIFSNCHSFIRTFPVLPRDDKDLDDVNTDAEDHIADEVRYKASSTVKRFTSGNTSGLV